MILWCLEVVRSEPYYWSSLDLNVWSALSSVATLPREDLERIINTAAHEKTVRLCLSFSSLVADVVAGVYCGPFVEFGVEGAVLHGVLSGVLSTCLQ